LLAAGADANANNAFGAPVLCSAISHGHGEAALLLLAYGADPAAMMRGMNALDWAISLGMKDVADTIREGGSGAVQNRAFFEGLDVAGTADRPACTSPPRRDISMWCAMRFWLHGRT